MSLIVGPLVAAELKPLLSEIVEAIRALQTLPGPAPMFACAATELPAASRFPACAAFLTDLKRLAISDGVHWIRQDTGAIV